MSKVWQTGTKLKTTNPGCAERKENIWEPSWSTARAASLWEPTKQPEYPCSQMEWRESSLTRLEWEHYDSTAACLCMHCVSGFPRYEKHAVLVPRRTTKRQLHGWVAELLQDVKDVNITATLKHSLQGNIIYSCQLRQAIFRLYELHIFSGIMHLLFLAINLTNIVKILIESRKKLSNQKVYNQ